MNPKPSTAVAVESPHVPDFADMIPLAEAARRAGVTYRTARNWTLDPVRPLRSWRVGGGIRTTAAALADFVASRTAAVK